MHDFVRTGGSVNSVWKQFSLQVEWGIKWNLDRIIFITLEWMILEFIAYKEGKKKIYWYLIKLLAKLEGHIVSRPPAKPKQSQFAKYRNTPLDIDFQCTISLCQFSHVKPPRKRSRTTNDRLGIFLLIHTHTHAHRALVTWILRQNQAGTVTQEEHVADNEFCWECAFLLNQAQHMLQCQTLSNVWITAHSKLGLVSPALAWNVPPLASEGKLPWYRDHLQ